MVCDYSRHTYRRQIQPFHDSDATVTIRWYRAPTGAKPLPVLSRFCQLEWQYFGPLHTGLGEVAESETISSPRDAPPCSDGQSYYGDGRKFIEGTNRDPAKRKTVRDHFGTPLGCGGNCQPIWFRVGEGEVTVLPPNSIIVRTVGGTPSMVAEVLQLAPAAAIGWNNLTGGVAGLFVYPASETQPGIWTAEGQTLPGEKVFTGQHYWQGVSGYVQQLQATGPDTGIVLQGLGGYPTMPGGESAAAAILTAHYGANEFGLYLDARNRRAWFQSSAGGWSGKVRLASGLWADAFTGALPGGGTCQGGFVITPPTTGGLPPDGVYGDVELSSSGTVWTIVSSLISAYGRTLTAAGDPATARATLALGSAATHAASDFADAMATALALAGKQNASAILAALAALTLGANQLFATNASGVIVMLATGATGRALLSAVDQPAARTTLGLGTASVENMTADGGNVPSVAAANTWAESQSLAEFKGWRFKGNAGNATVLVMQSSVALTGDRTVNVDCFNANRTLYMQGNLNITGDAAVQGTNTGDVATASLAQMQAETAGLMVSPSVLKGSTRVLKGSVLFDGGTNTVLKSFGNFSSMTHTATGDYTYNRSPAASSADTFTVVCAGNGAAGGIRHVVAPAISNPTASQFRFAVTDSSGTLQDARYITVLDFGD